MADSVLRNSTLVNSTSSIPVHEMKLARSASVMVRPTVLNLRPTGRSSQCIPTPTVSTSAMFAYLFDFRWNCGIGLDSAAAAPTAFFPAADAQSTSPAVQSAGAFMRPSFHAKVVTHGMNGITDGTAQRHGEEYDEATDIYVAAAWNCLGLSRCVRRPERGRTSDGGGRGVAQTSGCGPLS